MKNFAHHLEYDNSRIELEDLKKISQRFYDHSADKKIQISINQMC